MSEAFDLNDYLRCDCASVGNQTCDKCVVRAHIATLQREADGMREALEQIARAGAPFDAKGTHAKRIADTARAALNGSPQERGEASELRGDQFKQSVPDPAAKAEE